jgi:hypothetical protein
VAPYSGRLTAVVVTLRRPGEAGTGVRSWWAAQRAGQRVRLARHWQTRDDLDEAAGHALRLVRLCPAPPLGLAAAAAVTAARIGQRRYPPGHPAVAAARHNLDVRPSSVP